MNTRHFDALRPVCPACRQSDHESAVAISQIDVRHNDHIVEGILGCTNPACQHEFPIIDGIPILVPQLRQYVSDNLLAVVGRDDLSPDVQSIIGDCCGPGSQYDHLRQHLSSYCWNHYGVWDDREADSTHESSIQTVLAAAVDLAGPLTGPILDIGCSVGGTTFSLADQSSELVLGIDVNFSMLRVAANALRTGRLTYPRRECGIVYQRREVSLPFEQTDNVDFWACDILAPPFPRESFATTIALNTLDSVSSPAAMLSNCSALSNVGGKLILACPYDWTPAVTAVEQWIGGHSQRGARRGQSDKILVDLLTPGAHPSSIDGFQIAHESDDLKWKVRWHERGTIEYRLHLVVAERQ